MRDSSGVRTDFDLFRKHILGHLYVLKCGVNVMMIMLSAEW